MLTVLATIVRDALGGYPPDDVIELYARHGVIHLIDPTTPHDQVYGFRRDNVIRIPKPHT